MSFMCPCLLERMSRCVSAQPVRLITNTFLSVSLKLLITNEEELWGPLRRDSDKKSLTCWTSSGRSTEGMSFTLLFKCGVYVLQKRIMYMGVTLQLQGRTLQAAAHAAKAFLPNALWRWPLISPTANPVILQINKQQSEVEKNPGRVWNQRILTMSLRNGFKMSMWG